MTYADAITICLKKYFDYSGRASRLEYWSFFLTLLGVYAVALFGLPSRLPSNLVLMALIVPWLTVSARRWHDIGQPGWLALLNLIPLLNIAMMYFLASKGTPGPNRFGPEPL